MYDLSLESGPRRKKTMVHVLSLLGCVAVGPTTEEALSETPAAIAAYRSFLSRHGGAIDLDEPIETRVVEHITEGSWLGNGSPYLVFDSDFDLLEASDVERQVERLGWLLNELAGWADRQSPDVLDAHAASGGRSAREVLLHVMGATGPSLSLSLATAQGFGANHGAAQRGEMPLAEALRQTATLVFERVDATSAEERNAVRVLPSGQYTLRKSLRRLLEHTWEHLAELGRRPGGPTL